MIYIAIVLIIVGLFFLWKAFQAAPIVFHRTKPFTPPSPRKPQRHRAVRPPSRPPPQIEKTAPIVDRSPKEQLAIRGLLYLDHSQNSRLHGKNMNMSADYYTNIHRIGPGKLIVKGNVFLIHSGNARYSYPAKELDQLLFQTSGIALIPQSSTQPAAVFLSKEVNRLREHIQAHTKFTPI